MENASVGPRAARFGRRGASCGRFRQVRALQRRKAKGRRDVAGRAPAAAQWGPVRYIMPSVFGSQIDSAGQYVTTTRKTSIVTSHGHTAIVSSVMPIFAMPDAT